MFQHRLHNDDSHWLYNVPPNAYITVDLTVSLKMDLNAFQII